jgi:hypothetical protein
MLLDLDKKIDWTLGLELRFCRQGHSGVAPGANAPPGGSHRQLFGNLTMPWPTISPFALRPE